MTTPHHLFDWLAWPLLTAHHDLRALPGDAHKKRGLYLPEGKEKTCAYVEAGPDQSLYLLKRTNKRQAMNEQLAATLAELCGLPAPKIKAHAIAPNWLSSACSPFFNAFVLSPVLGEPAKTLDITPPAAMTEDLRQELGQHISMMLPLSALLMNHDWDKHNIVVCPESAASSIYSIDFSGSTYDRPCPGLQTTADIVGTSMQILADYQAPIYPQLVLDSAHALLALPTAGIRDILENLMLTLSISHCKNELGFLTKRFDDSRFGTKGAPGLRSALSRAAITEQARQNNLTIAPGL